MTKIFAALVLLIATGRDLNAVVDADGFCRAPVDVVDGELLGSFVRRWFGQALAALDERPINEHVVNRRVAIRFLWLRSFHDPVVVRVAIGEHGDATIAAKIGSDWTRKPRSDALSASRKNPAERATLLAAQYDAMTEWVPLKLTRDDARAVPVVELERLLDALDASGLPERSIRETDTGGRDGAEWFFEYSQGTKSTSALTSTPKGGALYRLGTLMLELADIRVPKSEMY